MKIIGVFFLSVCLCGCATTLQGPMVERHTFWIGTQPAFTYEKESDINFSEYRNFTVFPQAGLKDEADIDPVVEKLILFILKNHFEVLGYQYVGDLDKADFIVGVSFSNEYKEFKDSAEPTQVPQDIPQEVAGLFLDNYTSISSRDKDYFADAKDNWGLPLKEEEAQETNQEDIREASGVQEHAQAKEDGYYAPRVSVVIIDVDSKEPVWSGHAFGTTLKPEMVLSAQNLIRNLLWSDRPALPLSRRLKEGSVDTKDGSFGIFPYIKTFDGVSFYPYIGKVYLDSPSYAQGLRPGDIITHMDTKSMLNASFSDCLAALNKAKGESLVFTVKTKDQILDIEVVAEDEAVAKTTWQKFITKVE